MITRLAAAGAIAALLAAAPACSLPSAPAKPVTLQVFAAASLAEAFTEVGRALEQRTPGLAVRCSFAGSQALAMQLEQGAVADVFASADGRWMDHVNARHLLAGEPVTFARNRLVVIVPRTNATRIRRLQDLARGGIKLVLGADAVPVGHYSRAVLANLARDPAFGAGFASRALRNVVSEEENVKSVVGKVQLGEADAGIVYRSDVTSAVARFVRVIEIPASANVLADYPIAVLRDAKQPDAARAFVAFVRTSDGQRILARHGLVAVGAGAP